jgi:DNA-binding transcriptional LysR family regulator
LRVRAQALEGGLEGRIRLAVDVLFPPRRLAQILVGFRKQFPTVALDLQAGVYWGPTGKAILAEDEIGIVGSLEEWNPGTQGFATGSILRKIQLVAVAAKKNVLANYRGPIPDSVLEQQTHLLISNLPPEEHIPSGAWRMSNPEMRLELIRAGLGWARVPLHSVDKDLKSGRLVKIQLEARPSTIEVPLRSAHAKGRFMGPASTFLLSEMAR